MADRIVLLKDGVVQQVAPPQQMYDHPTNVFVAGFVGSPAMNFVQARLEKDNGGVAAVFGETRFPIPREHLQDAKDIESHMNKDVVLGIRPEDMEDAEIAESTEHAATMEVETQVIESMGSEKYVYFGMPKGGETAHTQSIDEMESEVGAGGEEDSDRGEMMVARVSPESQAQEGKEVRLLIDPSNIHLFDPETEEAIL